MAPLPAEAALTGAVPSTPDPLGLIERKVVDLVPERDFADVRDFVVVPDTVVVSIFAVLLNDAGMLGLI